MSPRLLAALLASLLLAGSAHAEPVRTVVLMVFDGFAPAYVDRATTQQFYPPQQLSCRFG